MELYKMFNENHKGRKSMENRDRKKEQMQQTGSNPPVSVITLNVNGLNISNKRLSDEIRKNKTQLSWCLKRNSD